MEKRALFREAFKRTVPILCSYLFIGAAYGMMMAEAGQPWYASLLVSLLVYTGAFQFVLISFLAAATPLGTVALTALLMNSRQAFYSITFLDDFRRMGRYMPFMIHTMTDETYAVNCSLSKDMPGRETVMRYCAGLSYLYWLLGTALGALAGQLIPWDMMGIDFCMTALFVIILIDQWEHSRDHLPALLGGGIALICLLIFGGTNFMLPALLLTSAALLVRPGKEEKAA